MDIKLDGNINLYLKRTALILGWMLIGVGAIWMLSKLWIFLSWLFGVLSPFIIAFIVAYIFNPIVNKTQQKLKLRRIWGIIVVGLMLLLIFGLLFGILVPVLFNQVSEIVMDIREATPGTVTKIAKHLGYPSADALQDKITQWFSKLDVDIRTNAQKFFSAAPSITAKGASAVHNVLRGIGTVFGGIIGFFAAIGFITVIAFYSLLEFDAVPHLVRTLLPTRYEERTMDILRKMDEAVGGFLRGQIIAAGIVGILSAIGLAAIGMWKYALLIGLIAGVGNLIPYLGPIMGATPALLWAFFSAAHDTWGERFKYAGLVVIVFVIIQLIDGHISQPKIVGKSSHLHPLIVLAALIIGAQFGLTGMIVAVPLAAMARVLFLEVWWKKHLERKRASWQEQELMGRHGGEVPRL